MKWVRGSLMVNSGNGWVNYKSHPLAVPDYPIERGSPGYATMQKLLKLGATFDQNPGDNYPLTEEETKYDY